MFGSTTALARDGFAWLKDRSIAKFHQFHGAHRLAAHLIHIGYPKAGSTFLQAWFEQHPDLCFKLGGLGGFHNVYEIARHSNEICKYYVTSYEGLSMPLKSAGGINLSYGGAEPDTDVRIVETQASVCSVLKSLYPGSRVLIITRGFKGMIVSGYSQYVRMGGRLQLNAMCYQLAGLVQNDTLHYYDFDGLIRLYREAFGAEHLIILPYELLRDDQNKFLAVLEAELGLVHVEIKLERLNPSLSPEELYWYPLISRAVSAAAARLGPSLFRRIYTWYIGKTMDNQLRWLIRLLDFLRPARKITEADFPVEILDSFHGCAGLLRDNPVYEPYAADYLWDQSPREKGETEISLKTWPSPDL